jgi:hypothetical protein
LHGQPHPGSAGVTSKIKSTHAAEQDRPDVAEARHWSTRGIVASASFDGATDKELFLIFVRQALSSRLRPGQAVVMDNMPAHKSPEVDRLIESAGNALD